MSHYKEERERVSITSLPIELIAEILAQSYDPKSLKSAIFSCPAIYNAFKECKTSIFKSFISRKFYPEELEVLDRLRPGQLALRKRPKSDWLPLPASAHPVAIEYYAYERAMCEQLCCYFEGYWDNHLRKRNPYFKTDTRLSPKYGQLGGPELKRLDMIRCWIYKEEKKTFLDHLEPYQFFETEDSTKRRCQFKSPRCNCPSSSGVICPFTLVILERFQDKPSLPGKGGPYGPWLEKSDHIKKLYDHWPTSTFQNDKRQSDLNRVRWRQMYFGVSFEEDQMDDKAECMDIDKMRSMIVEEMECDFGDPE
ncbi:hypothetical protein BJ508DRAFT_330248 [Ascobolus immersus RN42]|uniref:F-box domain-containing protein n=1 Tax=Ascobolus immersus RN42 TaxID=1160509 RepID=A0A3N4HU93_ASCIM|nr:hypothetical protein BJ508DRAFT_330248 [Ascobolus immersus RN42]